MVDVLTGSAFDAPRRMHHREDEVALEFPSSVSSRVRNLLALKAQNWKSAGGSPMPSFFPLDVFSCREMFRDCTLNVAELDLGQIIHIGVNSRADPFDTMFFQCSGVDTLIWNGVSSTKVNYTNAMFSTFRGRKAVLRDWNCPNVTQHNNMFVNSWLEIIDMSGSDISASANNFNMFAGCSKLTEFFPPASGFSVDLDMHSCPLGVESAIRVMESLLAASAKVTLRLAMQSTYEANADFIAARDAAIDRGWTIAWSN